MSDAGGLEASARRMGERLARWCAIPSHAGDPIGQRRMADEVAGALTGLGARIDREPVGPEGLPALRASSPERAGRPVLLVGHYDTVPHDGPAARPEVRVEGVRLRARGAADMKGGLVVMGGALEIVEAGALGPPPPWRVIVVPDEEIGTPWSRGLLATACEGAVAALVFEPSLEDGRLVRSRKGVGTVSIDVVGRSAHAGRDPATGRSAIAALAELVPGIEALADEGSGTTVAVTTVGGGSASNVIAAGACAQVDVRVGRPSESDRVLAGIERIAREVAGQRGVEIAVDGGVHRPPRPVDAGSTALFEAYRSAGRTMGLEIDWADVGGGSDANLIPPEMPVLDGLGAVGGGLHAPDEYAYLPSLPVRAALAAALIAHIGGC